MIYGFTDIWSSKSCKIKQLISSRVGQICCVCVHTYPDSHDSTVVWYCETQYKKEREITWFWSKSCDHSDLFLMELAKYIVFIVFMPYLHDFHQQVFDTATDRGETQYKNMREITWFWSKSCDHPHLFLLIYCGYYVHTLPVWPPCMAGSATRFDSIQNAKNIFINMWLT